MLDLCSGWDWRQNFSSWASEPYGIACSLLPDCTEWQCCCRLDLKCLFHKETGKVLLFLCGAKSYLFNFVMNFLIINHFVLMHVSSQNREKQGQICSKEEVGRSAFFTLELISQNVSQSKAVVIKNGKILSVTMMQPEFEGITLFLGQMVHIGLKNRTSVWKNTNKTSAD